MRGPQSTGSGPRINRVRPKKRPGDGVRRASIPAGGDGDAGGSGGAEDAEALLHGDGLGGGDEDGLDVFLELRPGAARHPDDVAALQLQVGLLCTQADLIAPLSLDLNGNAITLSNKVWEQIKPTLPMEGGKPKHPISASHLKPVVESYEAQGKPFNMGMVFPVSTHNYELRYWLAAGGLNPGYYTEGDVSGQVDADVKLSVTPPPQMPATLDAGTIEGYCVGEPWNQAAVFKKIGVPVITDDQIWNDNPEKVFGLREDFAEKYPATTAAMLRAIIKAQQWLDADGGANRAEAVKILSQPNYVGADEEVIAASMTGKFTFESGDTRDAAGFNIFFDKFAGYPYYSDAIWYLTQMRRWGQIAQDKPDQWYFDTAKAVYRPDLYMTAVGKLVADGVIPASAVPETDGYRTPQSGFIDGITFDGTKPNEYLSKFVIGLKQGQTVTAAGVLG